LKKKYYDGYKSFSYLEPDIDYPVFELASETTREGKYHVNLTDTQEQRVTQLFEEHLMVSLRDHGFVMPKSFDDIREYCRQGYTAYSYEGLTKSGLDAIFENFMDGIMNVASKTGLKWDDIIWNLGIRFADIAHQDTIILARTTHDIFHAKATGRVALIPSIEASSVVENEIDRIDVLYGLGIRCMGVTYNDANSLGCGLSEAHDAGLTMIGNRAIRRMNQVGMAIDISHCGDKTSLDVIELSEKPVMISHAGARKVWNTPRMKPDEVLLACSAKGGVIGILAAPNTTLSKNHQDHNLDAIMEHFEYIVKLVGIDHVGFGPDTFFGDHVALQHAFDDQLSLSKSHSGQKYEESSYVRGVEDPVEATPNIVRWLVKHGYSDREIAKVTGGNIMRLLSQVWVY
jgi:membrane dipeptidase